MSGLKLPNSPLSVHSDSILYSSGSSEVARGREVGVDSGSGNQDEPHDISSFILPSLMWLVHICPAPFGCWATEEQFIFPSLRYLLFPWLVFSCWLGTILTHLKCFSWGTLQIRLAFGCVCTGLSWLFSGLGRTPLECGPHHVSLGCSKYVWAKKPS